MTITINRVSRVSGAHAEITDETILFAIKTMAEDVLYLYDVPPNKDSEPEEVAVYREIQKIKPHLVKITHDEKTDLSLRALMELFDMVHYLQSHIIIPLDEYKRIPSNYALLSGKFPLPISVPTLEHAQESARSTISFDAQNGVLRCGKIVHAFHRGVRGNRSRLSFFRLLWENKCEIKKGIVVTHGNVHPHSYFGVKLDIATSPASFDQAKKSKEKLNSLIKGVNRTLSDKHFPAKIEVKGGIQLVITK